MQHRSGMECDGIEGLVVFASEAAEGASLTKVIVDSNRDGANWRGGKEDE